MTKGGKSRRGFTLIELGVVVTIVGILAVIAIVGYRKYVNTSKLAEAKHMIGAIRVAEEDLKADTGEYLDLGGVHCPSDGSQQKVWAWDNPACNGGKAAQLNVHADGPVRFGYAVWAGNQVAQPGGVTTDLMNLAAYNGQKIPYYVIHAQADLNGDPADGITELATSSMNSMIYTKNEGN